MTPQLRGAGSKSAPHGARRGALLVAAGLLLAGNLLIYGQAAGFGFVNYDDEKYVTKNTVVQSGLNPRSLVWGVRSFVGSHWHPLTWYSHMLDCQIFGLAAGGHHMTSVAIHSATSVLLLFLLVSWTGDVGWSALAAGLWSFHPLRVESVAWIAERKDVLCALFFVLTLIAYTRYVRQPRWPRYLAVLAAFAGGLLAKPMVVTLPFVLLLLDLWPFGRWRALLSSTVSRSRRDEGRLRTAPRREGADPGGRDLEPARSVPRDDRTTDAWLREHTPTGDDGRLSPALFGRGPAALLLEKAPLLVMSAAGVVLMFVSQRAEGALRPFGAIPFGARLANAVYVLGHYLDLTIWPRGLAVFYPFEFPLPGGKTALSLAALAAITGAALRLARRRPPLLVGWLWYLGTLVPVIGLVQVGAQAYADRYTYLPSMGLVLALVFGVLAPSLDSLRQSPLRPALRRQVFAAGTLIAVVLAGLSWRQARFWKSSITLFEHALAVTKDNGVAHYDLGCALADAGRLDDALPHYREAVRIRADFPPARHNLGITLLARGQHDEAVAQLREAVRLDPSFGDAQLNLGVALAMEGRLADALPHLEEAVRLAPRDAVARYNLGLAQEGLGRSSEAIASYREVVSIDPGHAEARFALASALAAAGRGSEAIAELEALLKRSPGHAGAAGLLRRLGPESPVSSPGASPAP